MPVLSPQLEDCVAHVSMLREEELVQGGSSHPQGAQEESSRPQGAQKELWHSQGSQEELSAAQLNTSDPMVQIIAMQQAMLKELQLQ